MKLIIGLVVAISAVTTAGAEAKPDPAPTWWGMPAPVAHHARRHPVRAAKIEPSIASLEAQLAELRRELADVRREVHPGWAAGLPAIFVSAAAAPAAEPKEKTASPPDLRLPIQVPANPEPALPPGGAEEGQSVVDRARAYLVATATPGYTMVRQGVSVSIARLHPEFAVKLAAAVREARAGGFDRAGVFSAYRPPIFGVGGFGDKFNSLHSYGLAADVVGIGSAGSRQAHVWRDILRRVGLFLPYGPDNAVEFNHVQLIPAKVAPERLRATITASAPKDVTVMWSASGVAILARAND